MKNIHNYTYNELQEEIIELGYPKYRAEQIWINIYQHFIENFSDMKNIPKDLINTLETNYVLKNFEESILQKSKDGTQKALLELNDGEKIETVLMKYKHGYTVCVTTQVGCRIGCSFCASHLGGFKRNLDAGEIVTQVKYWNEKLEVKNDRVSNIVVMGIGEPFDNLDEVLKFVDIINHEKGFHIGARKITVSTSGVLDKFEQFINYDKQINLAISLHAADDRIRTSIMKINRKYNTTDIINAVRQYQLVKNRQVTFEYIMLKGINDSPRDAKLLSELIGDLDVHVNLIPYNQVMENEYATSLDTMMREFADLVEKGGVSVSIRTQKGDDIDGACGQLRNAAKDK